MIWSWMWHGREGEVASRELERACVCMQRLSVDGSEFQSVWNGFEMALYVLIERTFHCPH